MSDRLKVIVFSLTGGKNTIKGMWKLISTTISIMSSIFAFSVLLKDLLGFDKAEMWCKHYWYCLLLASILASLIMNRENVSYKGTLEGDDLQIVIEVNDLFHVNASSYVIPTNTFFRTVMEGEYISPRSVQGAFQLKFFKNNREELDQLILDSLLQQGIVGEESKDIYGAVKKYPIGTVAKVDHKGKHYYFVAINDLSMYGKPENQSYQNVDFAFKGLFETIKKLGHCDDLAMPLIGTGKAAIKEATIEKVAKDTVDRFLISQEKITRKLTICINPKDFLDEKVDLKRIGKYLDYRCNFR